MKKILFFAVALSVAAVSCSKVEEMTPATTDGGVATTITVAANDNSVSDGSRVEVQSDWTVEWTDSESIMAIGESGSADVVEFEMNVFGASSSTFTAKSDLSSDNFRLFSPYTADPTFSGENYVIDLSAQTSGFKATHMTTEDLVTTSDALYMKHIGTAMQLVLTGSLTGDNGVTKVTVCGLVNKAEVDPTKSLTGGEFYVNESYGDIVITENFSISATPETIQFNGLPCTVDVEDIFVVLEMNESTYVKSYSGALSGEQTFERGTYNTLSFEFADDDKVTSYEVMNISIEGGADINKTTTDYGVYLNSTVTLSGVALDDITSVTVGGYDAEIDTTSSTSTSLTFTMPDDFEYTTATVGNKIKLNSETELEYDLKVYPFYLYEDVVLTGKGDITTVAFVPDQGESISTDALATLDPFMSGVSTTANTMSLEEDYDSVPAYFIAASSGTDTRIFANPSTQANMLKWYKLKDGTYLSGGANGTPYVKASKQTFENNLSLTVINRTIETQNTTSPSTIGSGTISATSSTAIGYVVVIGHLPYGSSDETDNSEFSKLGYMYITDMVDGATTYDQIITFDFLWPKYSKLE